MKMYESKKTYKIKFKNSKHTSQVKWSTADLNI